MKLILRWFINAAALILVANIVPGFHVASFYYALVAALVIGLLNAVIRPILLILTLPVTIVTLGLFTFVINALLLLFASSFLQGFDISGFFPAVLGAVLLWAVSVVSNHLIQSADEKKA